RSYPAAGPGQEVATKRAKEVYERFSETVLKAAQGSLNLYIDFHQNSSEPNIDVATLGISLQQAQTIKSAYDEIRDRMLRGRNDLPKVNLIIEPVDKVTFGARVAKEQGILRLAKQSLHIELPAHRVLYDGRVRHAYTVILAELINRITGGPPAVLTRTTTLYGEARTSGGVEARQSPVRLDRDLTNRASKAN
ncbi:MAG: hypothetical protein ACREO5_15300, partial [Candidatus Binatia bacterium]